jgi:cytosine/uracil/thiamine/allantoin permease
MDPVPSHLRTWSTWAYVVYWISDATNVAAWEIASSMLAVGLSWYAPRLVTAVSMVNHDCSGERLCLQLLSGMSSLLW